jgi:hypothetical protein
MCRYGYVKMDKKKTKPKPKKTSTRMEKGQKPEPGKPNDQRMLKISIKIQKVARLVPGKSLEDWQL